MTPETETLINTYLQKKVVFFINSDKPLKSGKLLIFKFKDFYFNFIIKTNVGQKVFELPYPFTIQDCGDHIKFSYMLDDFAQNNTDVLLKTKILAPKKKNKLYNSVVVLSAIP